VFERLALGDTGKWLGLNLPEKMIKGAPRIRETDTVLVQVPFTMKELRDQLKGVGANAMASVVGVDSGVRELMERVVTGCRKISEIPCIRNIDTSLYW
jgi:hypothetical protein